MNENETSQKNATKVIGPTRQDRGRRILEHGGQIRRIDDIEYEVKSQTWPDRAYAVFHTERGWICSCPDHLEAGHHCKHMHAVEISLRMREAVQDSVTITPVDPTKCKHCGHSNIVKDGIRKSLIFRIVGVVSALNHMAGLKKIYISAPPTPPCHGYAAIQQSRYKNVRFALRTGVYASQAAS